MNIHEFRIIVFRKQTHVFSDVSVKMSVATNKIAEIEADMKLPYHLKEEQIEMLNLNVRGKNVRD